MVGPVGTIGPACRFQGTQAGDPVEAEAIRDAFFPPRESDDLNMPPDHYTIPG